MTHSANRSLGIACVLLSAVLFSAKSVLIKLAYQYPIPSETLLALRMLFSLPFFLGLLWFAHEPSPHLDWKDYAAVFLAGSAGYYGASILDFEGLHYVSAGLERLLLFMYPTLTVFISALFLKTPIPGRTWAAIAVSYGGMALVFAGDAGATGPHLAWGTLLVFGGALAYAGYLVASGVLMRAFGAARFTGLALTVATGCSLIHFGLTQPINHLTRLPPAIWLLSAALGFFCTFLPASLMTQGIRQIGAPNAALIGAIGPVFTLVLGATFLDEHLRTGQVLGGFFIMTGVILISFRPREE